MINKTGLRILTYLDSQKSRQELANQSGYLKTTVTRALGNLERLELIYKEEKGNQTIAKPAHARCVEVFQSLANSTPHVDLPDLLTSSMLNMLYYLNSDDPRTATELSEKTGHARATIYRNLRTLTNHAIAKKEHSRYRLREEFNDLHVFVHELWHHRHRVQIKRDISSGTILWESQNEFLVRTESSIEHPNYYRTGLDAFYKYGLQFYTTSEEYYFYSEDRESLVPEDLVCHLLLIENDSRHRKYALLLVTKTGLSEKTLQECASYYGIGDVVTPLVDFLSTRGETTSEPKLQWDEFETLASEYDVSL